ARRSMAMPSQRAMSSGFSACSRATPPSALSAARRLFVDPTRSGAVMGERLARLISPDVGPGPPEGISDVGKAKGYIDDGGAGPRPQVDSRAFRHRRDGEGHPIEDVHFDPHAVLLIRASAQFLETRESLPADVPRERGLERPDGVVVVTA